MEAKPRTIVHYISNEKRDHFAEWMKKISKKGDIFDLVNIRMKKVGRGTLGEWAPVGEGVSEFKFRDGTRVYYAERGHEILLLTGGDKSSQPRDITKAKLLWRECKRG